MNLNTQFILYAFAPALAMILAGMLAIWRAPGLNLRSAIMHFAGGIVFAVVAIELLPDLLHERSALATGIGFAIGAAAMLVIRAMTETKEKASKASGGLLFATAVDISIDGLILGIGFAAGAKQGILLTLALTFELVSLGFAVALEMMQGNMTRKRIAWGIGGLASLFILSACLGGLLLRFLTGGLLVGVLAFGAAALLFLVTEELLTKAHEVNENPLLTASFFVGFLTILLLELVS